MFDLLASSLTPEWISKSFPIIKFVLLVLIVIAAVWLIVTVLLQETNTQGNNVITGIQDTYYSQNKGQSREGRLKKTTIWLAVFITVAVLAFFILTAIYPGSLWS